MKGNKKGQATLEGAPKLILLFVLIGMLLGSGIIALSSFRTSSRTSGVAQVNNFTALNQTVVSFAVGQEVSCSGVSIVNSTGTTNTASFSVTNCSATLSDNSQNNTNHQATYTAVNNNEATDVLGDAVSGGVNLSTQLPTIGTLIGVSLILIVVIGVFAGMLLKK